MECQAAVLGLAGTFLFDLYLFSQSVLFSSPDTDAASIRGAVHALMVPLLLLSTTRRRDWIAALRVSRKAAFHSATLLIAGAYLIFISAVGYYVRYFGGEWGRALQLGLVFVALVALTDPGAVRHAARQAARLPGQALLPLPLRLPRGVAALHADACRPRASPQEMGEQVVRGLADMLESPAGGLWMKRPGEAAFRQTARWNMAQCDEAEDAIVRRCASSCMRTGWVVNLEEYRSIPRRYDELVLAAVAAGRCRRPG